MTEAFERFAALLKVSDSMLEDASREDLAECCRILALNVAHYRSRFGDLPLEESLNLLATETIDDDQARWLADGLETIVGVLGMLQKQHTEH
jgi:hypothetical protein